MTNQDRELSAAPVAALRALHAVTKRVHASLDLSHTLDAVARGVIEATGFGVAALHLIMADGTYQCVSVEGDEGARSALLGLNQPAATWHRMLALSQRWGELRFIDHTVGFEDEWSWTPEFQASEDPDTWHAEDVLFVPLTGADGAMMGTLSVDLPFSGRRPGPDQRELLALFADHAAIAIQHARLHSSLQDSRDAVQHAATHDPLTGLHNRAALMGRAEQMASSPRSQLAAIVLDVDGFKAINDSAGHQVGDELLVALAQRMNSCVRDSDILARTGGDEFVVIVAGERLGDAVCGLVRRLETSFAEPVQLGGQMHHVGVSIGAAIADTPVDYVDVIAAADAEMYRAKQHNRARTA